MKTAISVPDATFERAERAAKRHGLNRSQFYSAAAERYATELESVELKAAINAAVEAIGTDDSAAFAVEVAHQLFEADGEW